MASGGIARKPRINAADCLIPCRVLYVTNTTPVYFFVNFVGGTGKSATASNVYPFLRYTHIA